MRTTASQRVRRVPREEWAISEARKFLLDQKVTQLPVDPFNIAQEHGWDIITVGEAAARSGLSRDAFPWWKDGDVTHYRGRYVIVYNERANRDRIPYTIAHEIGHIVLKHLEEPSPEFPEAIQLGVFNREADIFAAELLMPLPVIQALGVHQAEGIRAVCRVSFKASVNREVDLRRWNQRRWNLPLDKQVRAQFAAYLKPLSLCCDPHDVPSVIPVVRLPEALVMAEKHTQIEIDDDGRVIECPRCGNKKFSRTAYYCRMCGLYLFNECVNQDAGDREHCGKRNPGDARYCEHCGAETLFLRQGLLATWEEISAQERGGSRQPPRPAAPLRVAVGLDRG